MKRVEFAILGEDGQTFSEPQFVDHCGELPIAIMRAVEDYLEAREGKLDLPILIRVHPSSTPPTC
jgi:hypothetical protein